MKKIFFTFLMLCAISPIGVFAATYADSDLPLILPRSTWENEPDLLNALNWMPEEKNLETLKNENPNSNENIPDYAQVERIVIHDTGCCNKETDDPKQLIKHIYKTHATTRGWGDIGYHYIIDKSGNIYEGRFGGNGVRGAHVYDSKECRNFNVGTIGISILGDYQNSQVPQPAFETLIKLVGWLSAANGTEPDEMQKTTLIWTNPKINNKCSAEYGAFSTTFTGPVVLGHNQIELANSDPGTLDMEKLRNESKKWKDKYSTYAYNADGETFSIKNGLKEKLSNYPGDLMKISSTQAGLFSYETKTRLPEGSLVRARSRPDIFLIENGKRRLITSYEIFKNKKFSLSDVKTLGDRELIGYSLSDPIIYADGSLLESETTKKIYFVKNAEKRYVVSDKALKENKLNKKKTIKVSDRELEYYKNGGVVALPEGTLITDLKKKDYYIVEDGGKKKVSDHNVFLANKLNKKKEIKLAKKDLDLYPEKGYVLYPDGTLIKKENAPEIYVVKENKLNWIQTMEEFKRSKYSMKKVIPLASSEFSKYALASAIASVEKKPEKIIEVAAVKTDIQPVAPQKISIYKNIRIAISEIQKDEEVRVTANGDFNMTSKNGTQKYNIGETAVIKWQGAGDIKFQALNPNTIFEILTYKDTNWNKTINFNKFRGSLEVAYSKKSDKVYVINELPFEEYLLGIGEALNSDQKEYQKAFAVSSRSYAAFHLLNGGKRGSDEIYHLNNTPSDQVYRGYNWEVYAPNLVSAVKETAGEVMKYNGKVARSVYSSDSGGITKNACALWDGVFCSEDYDYLVGGVHDPEGTERRSQTDIAKSHGVGMSATGGRRLAELGKNYKDILLYYYKGVTIENLN